MTLFLYLRPCNSYIKNNNNNEHDIRKVIVKYERNSFPFSETVSIRIYVWLLYM